MRRAFLFGFALAGILLGCSERSKGPVDSPAQPEGSADSTRVALFADSSLEAAVREALEKPAGLLTQADLLSLTQLVARGRGIASLAGIDSLKSLAVLDLADNQIADLSPLSGLTKLTYLDLENNRISDVAALAALDRLETLVFAGNQVADIAPLLELDRLKYLELLGNPLEETALQPCLQALAQRSVEVYWQVPEPAPEPVIEPAATDTLPAARIFSPRVSRSLEARLL